jgi:hypothetical protein
MHHRLHLILRVTLGALLMGVAATALAQHGQPRASGVSADLAPTALVTLEIPDVGCASCSMGVRRALLDAGGVVRLEPSDPRERILVMYRQAPGRPDAYVTALLKASYAGAHVVKD